MGLLEGRKALVFGVANDHSIAWGIAKAFHDEGAIVGFSSVESLIERRVRPLADSIGSPFVEACDVTSDDDIRARDDQVARGAGRDRHPRPRDRLRQARGPRRLRSWTPRATGSRWRWTCPRTRWSRSPARRARTSTAAASILTLSYYGAEKVVTHYNVMGVAKAALEASVRYLAADLGPDGIRVNAISAGPIRTLSAGGIAGFRKLYGPFDQVAPLRSHITIEDCGRTAVYLGSDLSSAVTGEVIYVDGGFSIMGVPSPAD